MYNFSLVWSITCAFHWPGQPIKNRRLAHVGQSANYQLRIGQRQGQDARRVRSHATDVVASSWSGPLGYTDDLLRSQGLRRKRGTLKEPAVRTSHYLAICKTHLILRTSRDLHNKRYLSHSWQYCEIATSDAGVVTHSTNVSNGMLLLKCIICFLNDKSISFEISKLNLNKN